MRFGAIAVLAAIAGCGGTESEPPTAEDWYGTYSVTLGQVPGHDFDGVTQPFEVTFRAEMGPLNYAGQSEGIGDYSTSIEPIDADSARYTWQEETALTPNLLREEGVFDRISSTEIRCADFTMRNGDAAPRHMTVTAVLLE